NYFTLSGPHGWEGKPIIHQTEAQQKQSVADRDRLIPLREKLLAAREQRIRPGRDGKILTDWNGLVIAALAEAGRTLKRIDWIEAAEQAFAA
ncbi:MAG: thioredoxin domain-containing protein, partial [Mesorhizobium sp.]